MNLVNEINSFLKEVMLEIKKVNWPTRQETLKYTLIVVGASFLLAFFLGGIDILFQFIISKSILK